MFSHTPHGFSIVARCHKLTRADFHFDSFCRRKRLGIVLMLHIITIETLVDSLHCLNKYIIFKMTAIVCPKDNIRIYLQRIYDLEKKKTSNTFVCEEIMLMIKPPEQKRMKVILFIRYHFTLMVCCFSVSPCQQLMLEISVFFTHLLSEKKTNAKVKLFSKFFSWLLFKPVVVSVVSTVAQWVLKYFPMTDSFWLKT